MQMPADSADFVFRGTVVEVGATTMEHVSAEGSATVRIDEVLRAPETLRHAAGETITVRTGAQPALQAGQQALFRTAGIVFGESIAVDALSVEADALAGLAAAAAADPVENLKATRAADRFGTAALVVTGTVREVRTLDNAQPAALNALAAEETPSRVSEHDPVWQEALLDVREVHKGEAPADGTVVVRFPASTDVMWHRAPKFEPGQEGVFMLHQQDSEAAGPATLNAAMAGPAAEGVYVAVDAADFQPANVTRTNPILRLPENDQV